MKKLLILLLSLVFVIPAFADTTIVGGGTGSGVQTDSDCDQSKYYPTGTLCQDTDDYKLYKGIGTGIQEIAAGGTGDVTGPAGGVTDADLAGFSGTTGKIIKKITALPDGTTATTQTAADGSTKVATTLYVDTAVSGASGGYADPDANAISMWDDTDGAFVGAVIGTGLSYDHASHTLSVSAAGDAAADGATKGIAAFTAADFDATAGVVSIDYTNGQKATGSVPGFLSSTDWTTFNNKQAAITRPVSGPASATTGNLATWGADNQTLADGGAPFNPAVPGPIGGTTPAAGTFTNINVTSATTPTTGASKDGSGNLVLTDAVTGSKKLSDLIPGSAPNLALSAGQVPFTADGVNLTAITMDTDLSSVSANDDTFPSAKATKAMGDLKMLKTQVFNQCTTVKGLVATDDFPVAIFPYAITITGVRIYHIGSTDVQGQFDECTGASGVCTSLTAVDADIDASSASVWTADDGSLSNPSIAANNGIWWHTTSVTGTNTFATMCFYYTID